MIEGFDVPLLRSELAATGRIVATDPRGNKLFIILSTKLDLEPAGLLIAYEREGAFFFTLDRPLNQFRLIQAGFSLITAPTLSALTNAILSVPSQGSPSDNSKRQLQATTPKDTDHV